MDNHRRFQNVSGRPTNRLVKKAQQLLAHLCVQYPGEGILFEWAAKLSVDEPLVKAQKLQKAYRAYTQVINPTSLSVEREK